MTRRPGDARQMRTHPSPRRAGDRSPARKVLASLGVVTTWGGVAALGTFGTFTDRSTPLDGAVDAGAVSIDLSEPHTLGTLPLTVSGLLPGGSATRTMDLVNDGDVPLSSVTMTSIATTSSRLDTDPAHGLQLTLHSCSVDWTPESGCTGQRRVLLPPGPVVREAALSDPASLTAGGTDHLAVTVTLPETAGNEFAGRRSAVHLTFTAVQRAGRAR